MSRYLCRVCRGTIREGDVDGERGVAHCPNCGAVTRSLEPSDPPLARPPEPIPPGLKIWETGESLSIAVRWFHRKWLVAVAIVAFFDFLMVRLVYFGML